MTLHCRPLLAGDLVRAAVLLTPRLYAQAGAATSASGGLVVAVVQMDVPVVGEWIGTLDGSVNAEIRPKVEGYLLRQFYKEGQFVRRNDPRFEIDSRQFRAALEQARGTLARAEAHSSQQRPPGNRLARTVPKNANWHRQLRGGIRRG